MKHSDKAVKREAEAYIGLQRQMDKMWENGELLWDNDVPVRSRHK